MKKIAVVVYNLGGPDSINSVYPFLKNLFSDPKILRMPAPVRWVLARLIAWRRTPAAKLIYAEIGGRSPILPETQKQGVALQNLLEKNYRVFVSMRYWHPFADAVARDVVNWKPERVILLPLYPQFSSTTTSSFMRIWEKAAKSAALNAPTTQICCWPEAVGFIDAVCRTIDSAIDKLPDNAPYRILFSAHGLPKSIVDAGDPYPYQVERTAVAVMRKLVRTGVDYTICYQSRVGPMEWLQPYTIDEIKRAGAEGKAIIVVPIAFVSEHSETLVELDIEYATLARKAGVEIYVRTATVSTDPSFIRSLADIVTSAGTTGTMAVGAICPGGFSDCPYQKTTIENG
ncbi:MAG: ferrochelatase [Pseudomonadota bacterium]|nr:ferrochelatase [Pseudomonadota bacterium]